MPGLVPGIHVFKHGRDQDVDGRAFASPKRLRPRRRDKPGHDEAREGYADFSNSSRPISMRRISLVPAPIS